MGTGLISDMIDSDERQDRDLAQTPYWFGCSTQDLQLGWME